MLHKLVEFVILFSKNVKNFGNLLESFKDKMKLEFYLDDCMLEKHLANIVDAWDKIKWISMSLE